MTNAVLHGERLTAELSGQLHKATISSHTYLDEQVHKVSSIDGVMLFLKMSLPQDVVL